jgi:tRNA-Thr(GGU) m(6)t(6)A37 methyltransferase TsaA
MTTSTQIEAIATVHSPFTEKFGVPRQSGLVQAAIGEVVMRAPYDDPAMLDGLAGFSHVWLVFSFHQCVGQGWRARVRPPRLGGNEEVGVFASRAPFRPNFLGLSAVRLLSVETLPTLRLRVGGLDLVDGTPIFDIKPYLPYADSLADAVGGFADSAPLARHRVRFTPVVDRKLTTMEGGQHLRDLIVGTLSLDPRPAYRQGAEPGRVYGVWLAGSNVRWRVDADGVEVIELATSNGREDCAGGS